MNFGVRTDKEEELRNRLNKLGVFEQDIDEKFVRSGGKGGQNVNKVSSCVYIRHRPTGIEVKCQTDRPQSVNRYLARRILAGRIEALVQGKKSEEQQRIEKIRRQKRKRSRRAKDKMLEAKRFQAEKKQWRAPVKPDVQ